MGPMERVAREIGLLVRSLKSLHAQTVEQTGVRLEMAATGMLAALDDRGRSRPSSLAEALHLDLSSVSRQAASLERDGLVLRHRDPADSRAALLELSPAGRDLLERIRTGRVAHLRELLPDWTDDDLSAFAESLHRFRTDLGRAQADRARSPRTHPDLPSDRDPALTGQERT